MCTGSPSSSTTGDRADRRAAHLDGHLPDSPVRGDLGVAAAGEPVTLDHGSGGALILAAAWPSQQRTRSDATGPALRQPAEPARPGRPSHHRRGGDPRRARYCCARTIFPSSTRRGCARWRRSGWRGHRLALAEEAARHPSRCRSPCRRCGFQRISLCCTARRMAAAQQAGRPRRTGSPWCSNSWARARPGVAGDRRGARRAAAVSLRGRARTGPGCWPRCSLALADVEPAAIAADYALSAHNLRDGYLKRYAATAPERILEILRCPEEGSHRMLAYLERAGGVPGLSRGDRAVEHGSARAARRLRD